jgi:hypothetical protein
MSKKKRFKFLVSGFGKARRQHSLSRDARRLG